MRSKGIWPQGRAFDGGCGGRALLRRSAGGGAGKAITVWWAKGFYKSEDDALFEAIKKFEAKTGSRSTCRNTPSRT